MKILQSLRRPCKMNSSRASHEIHGLPHVLVDGFKHRMPSIKHHDRCFFLTHYHSDHYGGLSRLWSHGLIYCTSTTANLICNVMNVSPKTVRRVTVGETISIKGARVTFMDANHCPGAAILLFQLDSGLTHLHTGDLRYCPAMKLYPPLQNVKIDRLYLDTTYAHPKHTFMAQDESISRIVTLAKQFIEENPDGGIIYMSAYNLGKERVIFALNDALQVPVFMDADKIQIISQIDGGLARVQSGQFTSNPHGAKIHICSMGFLGSLFPYFKPNFDNIRQHMDDLNKCAPEAGIMEHYLHSRTNQMPLILPAVPISASPHSSCENTSIKTAPVLHKITKSIAFIPTGWADMGNFNKQHSIMTEDNVTVCIVPYSEHSNYNELMEFVSFLKPREVIPTVFSDEKNRLFILDLFRNCVDRVSNMRNFIARLASPSGSKKTNEEYNNEKDGDYKREARVEVGGKNEGGSISSSSSSSGAMITAKRNHTTTGSDVTQTVHIDLCSDDEPEVHTIPVRKTSGFNNANGTSNSSTKRSLDTMHANGTTVAKTENSVINTQDKHKIGTKGITDNVAQKRACHESSIVPSDVVDSNRVVMWTCSMCTYCHKEQGCELFLQCSLCGSPRCK